MTHAHFTSHLYLSISSTRALQVGSEVTKPFCSKPGAIPAALTAFRPTGKDIAETPPATIESVADELLTPALVSAAKLLQEETSQSLKQLRAEECSSSSSHDRTGNSGCTELCAPTTVAAICVYQHLMSQCIAMRLLSVLQWCGTLHHIAWDMTRMEHSLCVTQHNGISCT